MLALPELSAADPEPRVAPLGSASLKLTDSPVKASRLLPLMAEPSESWVSDAVMVEVGSGDYVFSYPAAPIRTAGTRH